MLRQLLALIALLTGLAAMGAPVHAAVAGGAGAVVEQSDIAASHGAEADKGCGEKKQAQLGEGEKTSPCRKQKTVTVYIPTVQFGPDRAYE